MSSFGCVTTTVERWQDALAVRNALGQRYVFRGQNSSDWGLSTRLERDLDLLHIAPDSRKSYENKILDSFRRRARSYTGYELRDDLDLLALLQHHGGPTRLCDITRSFFVGTFFAIDGARGDVAVWAFHEVGTILGSDRARNADHGRLANPDFRREVLKAANRLVSQRSRFTLAEHPAPVEFESKEEPAAVLVLEPDTLFERVAVQQGLFLFPTNLQISFEANLASSFGWERLAYKETQIDEFLALAEGNQGREIGVAKIVLERAALPSIARDLHAMNVTPASIYPGLDGFAKSLSPMFDPDQV